MKERRSCCLFCTVRAERRAFVFSHHSDASDNRPRGFTAIMSNADGVNHIFARNGLVTVKADKFRDGVKGTAWANFKLRAVPCGEGSSVTVEDPPKSEEPQPPKDCPKELRKVWKALDAAGAVEGLSVEDLDDVLRAQMYEKDATSDALRQQKKRLHDRL
ncbi:MAG: hypothetical protein V3S88_02450 [Alphaproteobacteria bacterium]